METTMTEPMPNFDGVADLFISVGALNSPAELHGMLCGHLCGGGRYSDAQWQAAASDFLDCTQAPTGDMTSTLTAIYTATLDGLQDEEFGVSLLLPDDDTELAQRISALSHWCHGFLTGFGGSGVTGETTLSSDTADALRDFAAFVQINPQDAEDEDSEMDYLEIVEYVRVAILTIFMEIGILSEAPARAEPTLH